MLFCGNIFCFLCMVKKLLLLLLLLFFLLPNTSTVCKLYNSTPKKRFHWRFLRFRIRNQVDMSYHFQARASHAPFSPPWLPYPKDKGNPKTAGKRKKGERSSPLQKESRAETCCRKKSACSRGQCHNPSTKDSGCHTPNYSFHWHTQKSTIKQNLGPHPTLSSWTLLSWLKAPRFWGANLRGRSKVVVL